MYQLHISKPLFARVISTANRKGNSVRPVLEWGVEMSSKKQILKRATLYILLPVLGLFLLLNTTNPYELPLAALIIPFVLIFVIVFHSSFLLLSLLYKKSSDKRHKLNAAIIAIGISLMALLQSIKQLSIQDLIILVCLIVILSFYTRRIDL